MIAESDTASAGADKDAGRRSWPDTINERLAEILVDRQFIDYFENQPTEFVRQFQMRRLVQLARHAARHSSWWREHMGGFAGDRQATLADFPILSREELRASIEQDGSIPAPPHHGAAKKHVTSGSSGVPLSFFITHFAGRLNRSHWFHDDMRQGRNPQGLRVELSGRVPPHDDEHIIVKRHPLIGGGIGLRRCAPALSMAEHARWLSKVQPSYIATYPNMLMGLLDVYESGALEPPKIDQVMTWAETVDAPLRERTKLVLNATIRDRYSSEETGPIAFQCPKSDDHYHVAGTNVIVEIVDEHGNASQPGSLGRVLVSGLHNYASPIIRYELNDLAAWDSACPCGHKSPVLTQLLGRKPFLIRLPSGERKPIRIRGRSWFAIAPFREHRLMQVTEDVVRADLVLERPMTPGEKDAVIAMLQKELSPDLTYDVHQVERIDWAPTYKRQDVVSLV